MSRRGILIVLAIFFVAQTLATEDPAPEPEPGKDAETENPYGRPSHFQFEMYRMATVFGFIAVAVVLGFVVWKSCSWPRLE